MPERVPVMPPDNQRGPKGSKYDYLLDNEPWFHPYTEFKGGRDAAEKVRIYLYKWATDRDRRASIYMRETGMYVQLRYDS